MSFRPQYLSSPPVLTNQQYNNGLVDQNGNLLVAMGAGSAIVGKVGIDQTTPGTTNFVIAKPFAATTADWSFPSAASGIVNTTTASTLVAATAAKINYLTWLDISTDGALGAATEIVVRNGAAGPVIWRMKLSTVGLASGRTINFESPLRGSTNTLLEFATLTASVTGAVYVNAGGYTV